MIVSASHIDRKLFAAVVLLLLSFHFGAPQANAQVDVFQFDSEEQQQRFRSLSNEFRCPMCQYSNLTGSTGGVAEDLRREIHRMIMEGMTDEEIEQFMFDRYGDFIFFRPRLRAETVFLWFGPLFFLSIGAFIGFGIWRRAKQVNAASAELDEEKQQRLKQLLASKQ